MKIAVIALTKGGHQTAVKLKESLDFPVDIFINHLRAEESLEGYRFTEKVGSLLGRAFEEYDGLVCIMSLGIVVRTVAPYLRGKTKDPAIVVLDEIGKFAISVLSGHLGGANDLSSSVAKALGGQAVITTSTDVQGTLAPDLLASRLGFKVEPSEHIREINALLANGEHIGIFSDVDLASKGYPYGELAPGVHLLPYHEYHEYVDFAGVIFISDRLLPQPHKPHLFLRPPTLSIGVGCRRDTTKESIIEMIDMAVSKTGKSMKSIKNICSVRIKEDEIGLINAARELGVPFICFEAKELQKIFNKVPGLHKSEYVQQTIGVGGVCEPAAILGGKNSKLVVKRIARSGVTVAVAEVPFM